MANALALNAIYDHYLTTYARSFTSKYDTHKKSELRDIYNSIVKLNKESPLYLLDTSSDSQAFAVGIKEGARELHNVISSLGGMDADELFSKKVGFSSDENMVSAQYIGDVSGDEEVPSYEIEVRSLASPQVNLGSYLPSEEMELPAGAYSFDISIQNTDYEFHYNITDSDTNKSVQEKLARLISGADIGIHASVEEDGGLSALRLVSDATGTPYGRDSLFAVSDNHSSQSSGSVEYFGIGTVTRAASNAELSINGKERSVASNHFTLEKTYELTLNGVSPVEGQTATVGVKNDTESFRENINQFVSGYNSFLERASQDAGGHARSKSLLHEMKRISSHYQEDLGSAGLELQDDGSLSISPQLYSRQLDSESARDMISSIGGFAESLLRKADQISLNPMQYVNKTIVAYKNPGRNFASPYITSAYSGMMFNGYC